MKLFNPCKKCIVRPSCNIRTRTCPMIQEHFNAINNLENIAVVFNLVSIVIVLATVLIYIFETTVNLSWMCIPLIALVVSGTTIRLYSDYRIDKIRTTHGWY